MVVLANKRYVACLLHIISDCQPDEGLSCARSSYIITSLRRAPTAPVPKREGQVFANNRYIIALDQETEKLRLFTQVLRGENCILKRMRFI